MNYLTNKQKARIIAEIETVNQHLPQAPFDIEFLLNDPKIKNARYIVHNPQQLNVLYARLSGKTLDGKILCLYREQIAEAIANRKFTARDISRNLPLDTAQTKRELDRLVAAGELQADKSNWNRTIRYHYPE